ncbi:MAG: ABC transporter ATP-binding protein [Sphaerochaetaceae bacterium]|nr:ABC transporter ATP-binding protein [Sphaerochaetaceae bacterium]
MRLLFHYFRKSWKVILLILLLLSVKVASDLALPYYTSIIVNVGIQQNGIEEPVPSVLQVSEYELLVQSYGDIISDAYIPDEGLYHLSGAVTEPLTALFIHHYTSDSSQGSSLRRLKAIEKVKELYQEAGVDLSALQRTYILSQGFVMILVSLVSAGAAIGASYLASRIAAETGRDLRERVFSTVLSFHQSEIDSFGTPTLITRSTNDVTQIQNSLVMILRVVFLAPLMGIGGVIQVLATGTPLTWTIALAVGILISTVVLMFHLVMPRFRRRQALVDSINGILRETLKGLLVIRSFSRQQRETRRFEETNEEMTSVSLFVNRAMSAMHPIMMLIMNLTAILIVYAGTPLVLSGEMQVGDIMAFIQYSMMIIMSFLMISMLSIVLPRAAISAQRVEEILKATASIHDGKTVLPQRTGKGTEIVFEDVSFTFAGAETPALEHISCTFAPGDITGIIGSTGAGKSTLLNLIPRFLEPQEGKITLDGVDISSLTLKSLRETIGFVPQSTYLFNASIADNISFPVSDAPIQEVTRSALSADAAQFIDEKEETYRSIITSAGTNLSGGQRQRIAIARALYRHPPLLLFDDSFSALDNRTERAIRSQLASNHPDSTMIIVSQKVSTLRECDNIIVIDEGRIVSQGTHGKLLRECQVYQEIAQSQATAKEVRS